jgi:uncharacterized protein YdhG (YjbR/CyaY superfamily)
MDASLAAAPADRRAVLDQLRAAMRAAAPEAEETVGYGMPAFARHGTLVSFVSMKTDIGFYPTGGGIAAFQEELAAYAGTKGAVRFPPRPPSARGADPAHRAVARREESPEDGGHGPVKTGPLAGSGSLNTTAP